MAQWQYKTFCTELNSSVDLDDELRKILQDYGMKGWELVQVLQPKNDTRYHLVFKTRRPFLPNLEPANSRRGRHQLESPLCPFSQVPIIYRHK